MELWDLLDENGNKLGKTHVRSEKLPKGMYHLGVDVWIINSNKEILIQKRSMEKSIYPGYWAMTGGSALAGETSIEAAKRETFEELGINIDEKELKFINKFRTDKAIIDTYIIKKNILIDEIKIQTEEVSEVKWVTFEEIENLCNDDKFIKNRWDNIKKYLFL